MTGAAALQLGLAASQLPLEGKHLLLDRLGVAEYRCPLIGEHKPFPVR